MESTWIACCKARLLRSLLLGVLVLGGSLGWPATDRSQAQDEVQHLLNLINGLRGQVGSGQYYANNALMGAAQSHAQWMADTGTVSHDGANGSSPGTRAVAFGYGGSMVTENIYAGTIGIASADTAFQWWSGSSIHYHGMTDSRKNEIGIGIATNSRMIYYVLVFGKGGSGGSAPAPPPPPAQNITSDGEFGEAPAAAAESEAEAPAPPPPAATAVPTRPPITFTPSPTIPTATFTPSWTPTFTWTPSPTFTEPPPTSTPILLPTANLTEIAAWMASQEPFQPSPSPSATTVQEIAQASPQAPTIFSTTQPFPSAQPITLRQPGDTNTPVQRGTDWRALLVIAVAAQILALSAALWWFFIRDPKL